jgi:hypothetical protein
MLWRYTGLCVLILLTFLGVRISSFFSPSPRFDPAWLNPPVHDDPEGRLAIGLKLPLACANVWSVELIKGVSDTLALELIDKRFEIMRAAFNGSQMDAIQRARGVGAKTAQQLLRYLDLTGRCELQEKFDYGVEERDTTSRKAPRP